MTNPTDLDTLDRLHEAATPGPHRVGADLDNMALIAALLTAYPAMAAELRNLRAFAEAVRECDRFYERGDPSGDLKSFGEIAIELTEAKAELRKLRSEVEAVRFGVESFLSLVDDDPCDKSAWEGLRGIVGVGEGAKKS